VWQAEPPRQEARLYITAAIHRTDDKIQVFVNDGTYILYDLKADRAADGYPRPVNDKTWPGLGSYARLIVAGCDGSQGKSYFFLSDGRYLRYDLGADRVDQGYPRAIDNKTWPGMGPYALSLSAALNWKDGKIQFFLKDGRYIRYDVARDHVDDGYPKPITDTTWPGLAEYRNSLVGMFNRGNGKVYMFLGNGQYVRYDISADRVDQGYPKTVDNTSWPGMGTAFRGR
jgi:hypothetical protein